MTGENSAVSTRHGWRRPERRLRVRAMPAWRSMAALALAVTNIGLVHLAGVQPAHAATTFLVVAEGFAGVAPPALPARWTATRAAGRSTDQTWQSSTPGLVSNPTPPVSGTASPAT